MLMCVNHWTVSVRTLDSNYVLFVLWQRDYDRRGYRGSNSQYRRQHSQEEEPEWFSSGPTSQNDTIELRGFEPPPEERVQEEKQQEDEQQEQEAAEQNEQGEVVSLRS